MAYLSDSILDAALAVLDTDANRIDLCSQEPTTYAEATSTYSLGNTTTVSVGSPVDGTPNGRKVIVAAVDNGSVTATGTATHWAITDTIGSVLLAAGSLTDPQAVTSGNTWSSPEFAISVSDATDAV